MAKGKGGKVAMSPEVKALNDEAQTAVGAAEFGKAGELLEKACVAGGNRVELGQQAAQCYCMAKQWKEAVKACTSILDAAPANVQALLTRCQAYEEMGFYKQALADASAVAAFDNAPLDALKYKTRIEETIAANKAKLASTTHGAPRGMAGGMGGGGGSGANANAAAAAAANAAAVAAAAPRSKVQIPSSLSVKVTLEGETRLANVSLNTLTYPELLDAVAAKFPGSGPLILQLPAAKAAAPQTTVTCRNDLHPVVSALTQQYIKVAQEANGMMAMMAPLRIFAVKAAKGDVPVPLPMEVAQHNALRALMAARNGEATGQADGEPKAEYEIDEWLVDFAKSFAETSGLDPVGNKEHAAMGIEKLSRAVDVSLSDPAALPLFDKAADHFREAASNAIAAHGNLYIMRADRTAQAHLRTNPVLEGKALDAVLKEYDEAEKKFNEAMKVFPPSCDAHASFAQLEWERAKAKMGYVVPVPATPAVDDKAEKDAAIAASKETLKRLDAKKVTAATRHVEAANKWFDKALSLAKASDKTREKEGAEEQSAEAKAAAMLASQTGNILVNHGNVLYEWSQVLAAVKPTTKEWKSTLDSAITMFTSAGAPEADITSALRSHSQVEHLDLPPEPEVTAPPAPEPEVAAPPTPEPEVPAPPEPAAAPAAAKGLPSLEVKKKAKA